MATANQKKKTERAYTVKDIVSDDLDCAMINKLNMELKPSFLHRAKNHPRRRQCGPGQN